MVTPTRPLSRSPWARSRWLVIAPHQDDETLGAGALIAETAASGRLAAVAYLTDGSGSHPESCRGLTGIRRREARVALRRLGRGRLSPILDIGWQDARPAPVGSPAFARTCGTLAAFLRHHRIDAIAVTAADETHCDHAAAHAVAAAAVHAARRRVALFYYRVWSEPMLMSGGDVLRTRRMLPGVRRAALYAHRSQLSPVFGPGFLLPAGKRRMADFDLLYRDRA